MQRFIALTIAALYFSGKPAGSFSSRSILVISPTSGSNCGDIVMLEPSGSMPRCCMKPSAKMPAHVPMDARNRSKGAGAESSPPPRAGWSVSMVNPP